MKRSEWGRFGGRLRYARKTYAGMSQKKVAAHLQSLNFDVSDKMIGYWETIESPSHERGRRLFYPAEIIALVELFKINGLWLYFYDRTPGLTIHPPADDQSALWGLPEPISKIDLELDRRIKRLNQTQKKNLINILNALAKD
jgi:hypothetical protein